MGSDGGRRHDVAIARTLTGFAGVVSLRFPDWTDYLRGYPLRLVLQIPATNNSAYLITDFWGFELLL
jgi:hypothetical protein